MRLGTYAYITPMMHHVCTSYMYMYIYNCYKRPYRHGLVAVKCMALVTLMESQSILLSTLITQLLYVASEQIQNSNDF